MAKKRGKPKPKSTSKKSAKKSKIQKPASAEAPKSAPVKDALHKLEILAEEKKVEGRINGVEKKEDEIARKELEIMGEEKKIEKETQKVEKIEREIKKEVTSKPLSKFNIKDLNKGIIGAFIGVVAHFAFIYGKEIAKQISTTRATILIIFSYILILILMYETGYREIREKRLLGILPIRATVIFCTSIAVIIVIFFLFNQISFSDKIGLYKQIAVTSVLASLGAGTADLIGRD
ncbi:DUF2391 family protein [Candidatus Woesearchaeota archaeon]|nr:DUF2391 family protein [Candidatus Woesearchaeota archaeon]